MTTAKLLELDNCKGLIFSQVDDFINSNCEEFNTRHSHFELNSYTLDRIVKSYKLHGIDTNRYLIRGYGTQIDNDLPNGFLYLMKNKSSRLPIYPTINYGFAPIDTKLPKKVIINDGATVLIWDDGDKTIVKKAKDDNFDPVKGFLWAYFQKHSGLSKTKANKYLRDIDKENEPTLTIHIDNANLTSFIKNIFKGD